MTAKQSCVVAYSGGLDTSAIVPWLLERGNEVHAVLVDVGQVEDMRAMCARALDIGAASAVVRDAKPAMAESVLPLAIALGATYEGTYRLGTALARPFIALEQVKRARELGATTLVHGATGKGNDQIRFEYAYRSLMPDCEILAPWKTWDFDSRTELIKYVRSKGIEVDFAETKTYSLDENLWHLSVEGGALEDPRCMLNVPSILETVRDRFAISATGGDTPDDSVGSLLEITFEQGVPVAINGMRIPLIDLIATLNQRFRHAAWAHDLVLENRFTGIKSRGIYINPAAKLLHIAIDSLARSCLCKTAFDAYAETGRAFSELVYRGQWFSQQRRIIEASGYAAVAPVTGTVAIRLGAAPYVARIDADASLFQHDLATFEASDFDHADAAGFIKLGWLSTIGRPEPISTEEHSNASTLETGDGAAPRISTVSPVSRRRLVSS